MTIDNSDKVIDSRDVIARIEELESEREDLESAIEEAETEEDQQEAQKALEDWDSSEYGDELMALKYLQEECECYSDWVHGESLISSYYWVDYVQELVSDIGDLPRDIPDYLVIDWEATAENIAADYSIVDFNGQDYYIRNC